jgi:hypothetical protein
VIDLSFFSPVCGVGLLGLLEISSTNGTKIARASACNESQQFTFQKARSSKKEKPTFQCGLVISVFHRTAICRGLLLGFPLEHAGHGAEDVQVETSLCESHTESAMHRTPL